MRVGPVVAAVGLVGAMVQACASTPPSDLFGDTAGSGGSIATTVGGASGSNNTAGNSSTTGAAGSMEPTVDASGAGGGNVGAGGNAGSPGTAGTVSAGGSGGVADGGGSAGNGGAAAGVGGMGGKGVGGMGGKADAAVGPDGSGGSASGAAGAAGMAGAGGAGGTGGPADGGAGAHIDAGSGAGGAIGGGNDAGHEPHTVRCGSVTCDLRAGEYCCLDATPSCVGAQQGPGPGPGPIAFPATQCSAGKDRLHCDDSSDCAGSEVCCAVQSGLGSTGDATCTRAANCVSIYQVQELCDPADPEACSDSKVCSATNSSLFKGYDYCHRP
jgi:hypothetical protein